ncbi:MAG: phenylpyruvate tautomerase MIF-related protein [Methylomonas sp.]|jgi:phenylpyruvate tautomerase PptA (4-oxalocrotonate tautomerase family)|uniref:phenylpyruvate tautomerase MIF-related protein n=1 Tax=Methylomonas sp. TaxID=418 RepID=UPI0025D8ED2D|nr:phenylpyruvate tautomerase MIF-related protein [Methylomonas sp.]MCK9607293.1 phenylpyruvate tautomerase MIF-related protein [Methylomonas sp.]
MPYLKLSTNVKINPEQSSQLLADFSRLLSKETGKPERYVMVELAGDNVMMFGGNTDPLAYAECKSIGLSKAQANSLSAGIAHLLQQRLSVPMDRVYVEFSNCPAEFWGWNGSTFG